MRKTFVNTIPYRLALLICFMSIGICLPAQIAVMPGVSQQLAVLRKAQVTDVTYTLHFQLPLERKEAVRGSVVIDFIWNGGREDLQIDFQGKVEGTTITVNGKKRPCDYREEHIVVSRKWLRAGKSNHIGMEFVSGDKALNRNDDYLYSLFVPDHARSVFPCLDQPDIKACFALSLTLPRQWTAISNADMLKCDIIGTDTQQMVFATSDPLPTYLFSFTAGRFQTKTAVRDGRSLTALYRETDPKKVAQLETVFDQIALSLNWLEKYTGIRQPFQKYGVAILPGYQFGGMEHPGCIQLRDQTVFLGEHPTPDELLNRLNLLAHETSHLWFGDLVTMRWFNDVWTKEVFANFMADKISREQYPQVNHDLNFLKAHYVTALATDRTDGTHPIQQALDNLHDAGLLYGNIIYHKAPIMMRKLEERMGAASFQRALRGYLSKYAFGNATWDDLIAILDEENPTAGIKAFDTEWVKEKGAKPLRIDVREGMFDPFVYGRFSLSDNDLQWLFSHWFLLPETRRYAAMMYLYESWLNHRIDHGRAFETLFRGLQNQDNPLVASTCINYLLSIMAETAGTERFAMEQRLYQLGRAATVKALRRQVMQGITRTVLSPQLANSIYAIWQEESEPLFNERDYMRMAYHLAILKPKAWTSILSTQRSRLENADQLREFDFVSRACTPDTAEQHRLFESLLLRENRRVEPHASALMSLLNHPLREPMSNCYILPALEALEEIQRTGDIFFPLDWCQALLGGHHSREACQLVKQFESTHSEMQQPLLNKLRQAAFRLKNSWQLP